MKTLWRVLVVSACPGDHDRLRAILDHSGWSVHSAASPADARLLFDSQGFSVVVTDLEFPDGSCWKDVLRGAAGLPDPPPVVIMSSLADAALWSEALTLGAYDILLKPLDAGEVSCALEFARPLEAAPPKFIKGVVMVVDAPEVQSFVRTVLRRDGYHVLTPSRVSAPRLLQLIDVAAVITNCPESVCEVRPDARILYVAAVPDRELVGRLGSPAVAVLEKPFRAEQLLAAMARLVRKPAGAEASIRLRDRTERLA